MSINHLILSKPAAGGSCLWWEWKFLTRKSFMICSTSLDAKIIGVRLRNCNWLVSILSKENASISYVVIQDRKLRRRRSYLFPKCLMWIAGFCGIFWRNCTLSFTEKNVIIYYFCMCLLTIVLLKFIITTGNKRNI